MAKATLCNIESCWFCTHTHSRQCISFVCSSPTRWAVSSTFFLLFSSSGITKPEAHSNQRKVCRIRISIEYQMHACWTLHMVQLVVQATLYAKLQCVRWYQKLNFFFPFDNNKMVNFWRLFSFPLKNTFIDFDGGKKVISCECFKSHAYAWVLCIHRTFLYLDLGIVYHCLSL